MPERHRFLAAAALAALAVAGSTALDAQFRNQSRGISLPLASPKAAVSQTIGVTEIELHYHRPAVNGRTLWGGLVPYGQVWRTGANENTLISFGTDVTVEGQPLAAGSYGLHTLPGESEWQVIFSHDTTAWGSFSYDESRDALRVKVAPQEADHVERMSFTFDDVGNEEAVLNLRWEKLRVPIRIGVDRHATTLASIRDQLKGLSQFFWLGWNQAANYCLQNDVNLEEAVAWVDNSIQAEERFENLSTKSRLLAKTGDEAQAAAVMERALERGTAGQLHNYGRQLQAQGRNEEAMAVFERNARQNPDAWFIGVGLARGHSALGNFDEAVERMKDAWEMAPESQKEYIRGLVERLETGEKI